MIPMSMDIRPNSRVGEDMQILHTEREGNNLLLAMWGGHFWEADAEGVVTDRTGYFGTLKLEFSTSAYADAAERNVRTWQARDTRLLVRAADNGYASVTDPNSGVRVSAGRPL